MSTTTDERRQRLDAVLHAVLVLSDGKTHTGHELFQREEGSKGAAWEFKALSKMYEVGLIAKTGSVGRSRAYRIADGASADPYLEEARAAFFLWDTGLSALWPTPQDLQDADVEGDAYANIPDPAQRLIDLPPELFEVDDPPTQEPAASDADAMQALLGKLFTVLESFDARLKKIEDRPAPQIDEKLLAEEIANALLGVEERMTERYVLASKTIVESISGVEGRASRAYAEATGIIDEYTQVVTDNQKMLLKKMHESTDVTIESMAKVAMAQAKRIETWMERAETAVEINEALAASMVKFLDTVRRGPSSIDAEPTSARPSALSLVMESANKGPAHFKKGPRT